MLNIDNLWKIINICKTFLLQEVDHNNKHNYLLCYKYIVINLSTLKFHKNGFGGYEYF